MTCYCNVKPPAALSRGEDFCGALLCISQLTYAPCSTTEDGDAPPTLPALEEDHPLRRAQREDLQALAVTLLEVIFSALAGAGPSSATAADALQRLLFDVFQRDVSEFRCAQGLGRTCS